MISIDGISTLANTNATTNYEANKLKNSVNNVSSETTEDELLQVCKDFESYFIEQVIKQVKESLSLNEEENSSLATLTDYNMDFAIEAISDEVLDEVGTNFTQQLYEQMKRNYGIE